MNTISVQDLKKKIENKEDFQLIDVREVHENEEVNIGGDLIPLAKVIDAGDKIRRDVPVIIYCRSGMRSALAISELEKKYGFTNLLNLEGGIMAYLKE